MPERAQVDALADLGQLGQVVGPAAVQVVEDDLPGGRDEHAGLDRAGEFGVPVRAARGERLQRRVGGEHPHPVLEHDAPLVVNELAVAPGVPVHLQVGALGDTLRVGHRPVRRGIADPAVAGHLWGQGRVRGIAGDQFVLHADEEDRAARVALTAGPPAQLVVHADARVPPGADDVQAAERGDPLVICFIVPAEADVGAAARHLGGHGDRAVAAGLGDDRRLGRVVLGVEHDVRQAFGLEPSRQPFRLFDVQRADQHRAPGGVRGGDLGGDRVSFCSAVAYSRSGSSSRTHGRFGGITATSSP